MPGQSKLTEFFFDTYRYVSFESKIYLDSSYDSIQLYAQQNLFKHLSTWGTFLSSETVALGTLCSSWETPALL